jgi:hypothetical protein
MTHCLLRPRIVNIVQARLYTSREDIWKDMQKQNDEIKCVIKELEAKGHKCVIVMESYPVQISWCKKEPCVKTP